VDSTATIGLSRWGWSRPETRIEGDGIRKGNFWRKTQGRWKRRM